MCLLVVWRMPKSNGILLTFDDGPDPNVTPAVLDLLRQYGAKAMFFVSGCCIETAPELLTRIVAEGHALGNHSFAHRRYRVLDWKKCADDLEKCNEAIAKYVSELVKFYRPPHGQLGWAPFLAVKKAGMRYIRWSVSIRDWELRDVDAANVIPEVKRFGDILVRQVKPGDIVLLHDYENPLVVEALKIALPVWKERGWALDQWDKCSSLHFPRQELK